MVATVTDDPGRGCVQDLREPAFHRVLTVIKSLDLLAAERAQLEQLIHQGLTTQVRRGWGGLRLAPPLTPLTCLLQVLLWFEDLRHVITREPRGAPADVENLAEAFYDLFMVREQPPQPGGARS